ncbi:hypothetical protein KR044_003663 [Drosophila immigrans]|nr:hypothetical protein KR044_003663 [Drosophila immigrans]
MARYQLISSLLLLAILVASTAAQAPRRLRLQRRQQFARQEVAPTPYPSADELKPEEPALIYGPPPSTDVDELPAEQEPDVNSFQPEPETSVDVDVDVDAEELDTDENTVEETTQAAAPARLRSSRQRLAKLQLAKAQPKRLRLQRQRQRIARLEELPVEVPAAVAPVPVAAAAPVPQFYYVGAQQPYVLAYNAPQQQLGW